MDFNKLYGLDKNGERLDKPKPAPTPAPPVDLPPVTLEEAHDEVLRSLVDAARLPGADPKIQAQALDALYKRKYGEGDKDKSHDIVEIMATKCEACMKLMEDKCRPPTTE